MKLTNEFGISLPLAVWLLHDDYDYVDETNYISATSLLKSTKQLVLSRRVNQEDRELDISAFLSSRFGSAVHDSIEKAWKVSATSALKKLGYPDSLVQNVIINPTPEEASQPNAIPIYFEKRSFRDIDINGVTYKVGGKFDIVAQERLFDTKTTSVYSYILGGKDEDYSRQGSIYRWLNPDLIKDDHIYIQFLFTDWQRAMAKRDPKYPQVKALEHPVEMLGLEATEQFIRTKLTELHKLWNSPEASLPACTDKELWRGATQYKYFADPAKTSGRSTRNFDSLQEANAFKASKAGKGVVIAKAGDVKACEYCPAFSICQQKDQYYDS